MKNQIKLICTLFFIAFLFSGNAQTKDKTFMFDPLNENSGKDPDIVRLNVLDKVFRDFVHELHGENKQNARKFLSKHILDQVAPENMEALSKSIRRDNELVTISEKIGRDHNANNMEYIDYKYKVDTEPIEIIQIRFDDDSKIVGINSTRPNKK
ncbi:MAG: hypothetical protein IPM51_17310 [Sphingobacteriaceae bacterium]|nr:hypothetical protein [Sphingobacteriaceae bacterium]